MLNRIFRSGFASKLVSDGFWVAFGFGINAISALLISILLAHLMDEKNVGVYFLAFSIVTVMSGAVQFGLNISVVRFLGGHSDSKEDNDLRDMLLKMFLIVLSFGVIVAGFFMSDMASDLFGLFKAGADMIVYLGIIGLWILFVALRSYMAEVFRGFHEIKMAALYQRILPNLLMLVGLGLMLFFPVIIDLHIVFYVFLIVNVILVSFASVPLLKRIRSIPKQKKSPINKIIRSGGPIVTGQLLQFVVTQAPLWVLGVMSTAEDVADYGVAFRLAAILSLPLLVANNVIMSRVAKFYAQNDKDNMEVLIKASVVMTSAVSVVLMLIYVVAGEWTLEFLFGNEYADAYILLLIIAGGHLINVFSGSPSVVLAMAGMERYVFISSLLSAIVTVFICIIVIPLWGTVGAALATALGLIVLNLLLVFFCIHNIDCKTFLSLTAIRTTYARVKL